MTSRQVVLGALVIAVVCCAVMWWLEGFRMHKLTEEWKAWLGQFPTVGDPPGMPEVS